MIYLYLKTHNKTGLKYLGKTIKDDPFNYLGSGKYWKNHLKIHGYNVTTEILKECETEEELEQWGLYYSNLWNIVDSKEFANLTPENGKNPILKGDKNPFYGKHHSQETREKISRTKVGSSFWSEEAKKKMSETRKGTKTGKDNHMFGKHHSEESKLKMSLSRTGQKRSEETKEKMREAWKRRKLNGK